MPLSGRGGLVKVGNKVSNKDGRRAVLGNG